MRRIIYHYDVFFCMDLYIDIKEGFSNNLRLLAGLGAFV